MYGLYNLLDFVEICNIFKIFIIWCNLFFFTKLKSITFIYKLVTHATLFLNLSLITLFNVYKYIHLKLY